MQDPVLVLNATFEPINVTAVRRAMVLMIKGVAQAEEIHHTQVHSASRALPVPSVIRLLRFIKIKRNFDYVPFSRANIYARDNHECQYCGDEFPTSDLTFDHVIPVAQGGRKDWENIVTACVTCNRKKGGRTPAEAGMHMRRMPRRPESAPAIRITVGLRNAPESWRDYLYWNVELDDT